MTSVAAEERVLLGNLSIFLVPMYASLSCLLATFEYKAEVLISCDSWSARGSDCDCATAAERKVPIARQRVSTELLLIQTVWSTMDS
jgi:hypothetical protein